MIDLKDNISPSSTLTYGVVTASANGATVDRKGWHSATAMITIGAWTDGSHTLTLEDSDDGSTWATVATSYLNGTMPAITDATTNNTIVTVGYIGSKRYLRAVTTVAGVTTGAIYGAHIIAGHPRDGGVSI